MIPHIKPTLSIVIASIRLRLRSDAIIANLNSQVGIDRIEVVIVDDCPNTASLEDKFATELRAKSVIYKKNNNNEGVAISRNLGANISNGCLIAFWDDDAEYVDTWSTEAEKLNDTAPDIVAFCGKLLSACDHPLSNLRQKIYYPVALTPYYNKPKTPDVKAIYTAFAHGGNSVYRASVFKDQKGFSIEGIEDIEMGYRINAGGLFILFNSSLLAVHSHNTRFSAYFRRSFKVAKPILVFNSMYQTYADNMPYVLKRPGHSLVRYISIDWATYVSIGDNISIFEKVLLWLQHFIHAFGIVWYENVRKRNWRN